MRVTSRRMQRVALPATMQSASSDYGTPEWLKKWAKEHYGPFDLDPAATAATSLGKRFYSRRDGGLTKPWTGLVYCNPPHARALGESPDPWLRKAVEEIDAGRCRGALMLVPARTDTAAFHEVIWARAHIVYLIRGRLRFVKKGTTNAATFPSMLVVFGPHRRTDAQPRFRVLVQPAKAAANVNGRRPRVKIGEVPARYTVARGAAKRRKKAPR